MVRITAAGLESKRLTHLQMHYDSIGAVTTAFIASNSGDDRASQFPMHSRVCIRAQAIIKLATFSRMGRVAEMQRLRNSASVRDRVLAMAIGVDFPQGVAVLTDSEHIPNVIPLGDKDRRPKYKCVKRQLGIPCFCRDRARALKPKKSPKLSPSRHCELPPSCCHL